MAAIEKTINVKVNGKGAFATVQRFTSRHLARPSDLFEAQNVDLFENPGKSRLGNKGYLAKGSTLGGTIRGLYGHVLNDGTGVSFAIKGNNSYLWNGSAWSNSGSTTLTGTDRPSFTSFLNRALMTDGTQTLSSADGITWDSTLFTSAPTNCLYIERFDTRIFLANKSTIYWSSQPNDALTDVTWNTTEFDVVPETDDGDYMTGIKRLGKRLLVFKNFSTIRMFITSDLDTDLLTIDEKVGCTNKDAVITYGALAYFFGTTRDGECGIFQTNGDSTQIISRAVQDIVRAIPQSSYPNIRAGLKNGIIKFYVGDVIIEGKTISKCELQFSPRDDGWQYRSLAHAVTDYSPMKIDDSNDLFFAESTGLIMQDENGSTFDGTEINFNWKRDIYHR